MAIAVYLKIPDRDTTKTPTKEKLLQLDPLGTSIFVPGMVCLLLALQWGGQKYAVSPRIRSLKAKSVMLTRCSGAMPAL